MLEIISKYFLIGLFSYSFAHLFFGIFDKQSKPSDRFNEILAIVLAAIIIFGSMYLAGMFEGTDFWNWNQ